MGKRSWAAMLLAWIVLLAGAYVLYEKRDLAGSPLNGTKPLNNLSRAALGTEGELALIGASRQELLRVGREGALASSPIRLNSGQGRHDYSEVAVDAAGTVYALETVLDEYGLYVQEERVLRYRPGESAPDVLYSRPGTGTSKRVGQIRGLQTDADGLVFYVENNQKVTQIKVGPAGDAAEAFEFSLPADRYLSEIAGTGAGASSSGLYYSTKRGGLYQVQPDGTSEAIYPLPDMDRSRKNFPERLTVLPDGRVLFVDRLLNAVTSMKPSEPGSLRIELDGSRIEQAAPGAESHEIMDVSADATGGQLAVALADRILLFDMAAGSGGGTLARSIDTVSFDGGTMTQRRLYWAAALALALAAVWLIVWTYVYGFQRRLSLFFKQVFTFVPLIVAAMLLLSNFIYDSFSARMEDEMKRELSMLARTGRHVIEGDPLVRLTSPNDYMNSDYQTLRNSMNFLYDGDESVERSGLYSTLYKYENGELYIIMDDDDGVNMFKPFGVTEENNRVLQYGEIQSGNWEDADGRWVYAIGPLYDSSGAIVGIYETGRDLTVLHQANRTIYDNILLQIGIITAVLVAVVLAATFYLLSSVRKLRRSVLEMASGNWDAEVNIRTRDEVGDLGEQFNRMARHIRTYIGDITSFSEASHRFVPQQFFKYLGKKGILDIHLGDQVQQNMTVLVASIRSFHQLSRMLTPKENFNFMNSFLKRFSPLVRQEDGLVSKYLGAGFMALYPSRADDALRSAVAIRRELEVYNMHRARVNYKPVDIGVAIHRGPLMLGIVGEEQRMEGNVISDDVNLTATLERLSETLGSPVLVSRTFFEQVASPERFRHRTLGRIRIEGQEEPMELIDVYEGDNETIRLAKDRTKELFERGIVLCQEGRFFDARETFVEVIKLNRMDKAAKLYFYLCDECYQKGGAAGWNGTLAV